MKKLLVISTFLTCISFCATAQSNLDHNNMIGFGCGFAGETSKVVQNFSKLINAEKFDIITQLLDSENNAEKFLAVVVCEKLNQLNHITLTDMHLEKIAKINRSNNLVSVCSGCTYWDQLTLSNMLKGNNPMRVSANYWIESMFAEQ